MRKAYSPTLTAVVLIAGLIVSSTAAAGGEFRVFDAADKQEAPDVHGTIIVWQQFDSQYGDYDIYVVDVNEPADPWVFIIGDGNDQMSPAVFENTIVWQDYVIRADSADWDIRLADISDKSDVRQFVVSDIIGYDQQKPAISGNIVVWQDGIAGNFDIYGADITDPAYPAEFVVAWSEKSQQAPAVHRTTVTWQDDYFDDWDIFAADVWQRNKPAEFVVAAVENHQKNPAISGDIVVWQDDYFGDWDIFACDISRPDEPVEFAIAASAAAQENPDIDGNLVVWQDDRNNNWDIFGYNLTTQREFQITDHPGDQTNPAVSGNLVVWQDNRGTKPSIYAVLLEGPDIAECRVRLDADVNKDCTVDFTDFSLLASQWLECGLEPQEACGPPEAELHEISVLAPRPLKGTKASTGTNHR